MKKTLFILFTLMLCLTASATGTFRVIIFADTNDDRLGTGFEANIELIQDELGIITTALDMENDYEEVIYEQFECNSAKLKEVIRNFRCGSDDIVAFFYFGHGARSPQDKSEFPQMCLGEDDESNWVSLEGVYDELVKKGGRFTFVMGDCCNNVPYPGVTPKIGILANASASTISPTQKEAICKLFLNSKGSILISGCEKNETSIYNRASGGFLLNGFIVAFEEYTSSTSAPDWETCLLKMKNYTVALGTQLHERQPQFNIQHPQWLNRVNGGTRQTPPTPTKPVVKPGDLLSALVNIANDDNDRGYRINLRSQVLQEFFAPTARVEIIGRNGTTSLADESAQDFINRISTAFRLRNFVIHEKVIDSSGRVTYLKLHEIYEAKSNNVTY